MKVLKFYKCPSCGVETKAMKWPISDFHDDGSESYGCPECHKFEIHEKHLGEITRTEIDPSECTCGKKCPIHGTTLT